MRINQSNQPKPERTVSTRGVAVVTGAGSGIGRAIVLELAKSGVACCLVGRTLGKLEEVARLTARAGVESILMAADLGDLGVVTALAQRIRASVRHIDCLVHSAAVLSRSRVEDSTVEEFSRLMTVNVLAPFALTKELLPEIYANRGQIVFVNSSVVNYPAPGTATYAVTKHALKGLADGLRQEVNVRGVRVISVFPGRTATPLQASLCEMEGREYTPGSLLQPEDIAAMVVQALALPPTAEVTDILIRPAIKS
jgi:short-subunit dehydrogenase